ncbi:MAG TPA: hypothetical protein VND40_05965 [Nitrososphaerales archaeon]|nr:hypothetical protein [Nitrososphaerales archaeon]
MAYLAHEDQTCTRSSGHVIRNGNGRTSALSVVELASGSPLTAVPGTHH